MKHSPHYQTFELAFPSQLDVTQVQAWVRTLGGTAPAGVGRLVHLPAAVIEVLATEHGVTHRLRVVPKHATYVVGQLRSLIPGSRVTTTTAPIGETWQHVVELGVSNSQRCLSLPGAEELSASLLTTFQGLRRGERLLYQWVLVPAPSAQAPAAAANGIKKFVGESEELKDQRRKLATPNFFGLLRLGVDAADEARASALLGPIRAALGSTSGPTTRFVRRQVLSRRRAVRRLIAATPPWLYPARLTLDELSGLLALPVGDPHVAGLPPTTARHWPPGARIPRTGAVLLRANFPGAERPVAVGFKEAARHIYITGGTGSGKTVLLSSLAQQVMAGNQGLIMLEAKGDLFEAALDLVPERRQDDVIVVDLADDDFPVGWSPLAEGDSQEAVEQLCTLFAHLYRENQSIYAREVLYIGLMTLIARPGHTFIDLATLLSPKSPAQQAWRDQLVASQTDPEVKHFWQRFEAQSKAQQDRIVQPVLNRVWELNRPVLRRLIGQSRSSFDLRQVLTNNQILLVNLAGVPKETAGLVGTLLVNAVWSAVQRSKPARTNFLVLDEAQSYINLPIDLEEVLVKARSYGLSAVLAHQHLGQMPAPMLATLLANAHTKVSFKTATADARVFAREFGPRVSETDFTGLGQYEVMAKIMTPSGVSEPVTGVTYPPQKPTGSAAQVRARSRARYGRPVAEVDAEIQARCTVTTEQPRSTPSLGRRRWGG